ncbi:hypothetical protein BCV69DRAFT_191477 [Microstroma glucosiphilum]|uniref:Uncharacterized protein n=1 Tax=Pseudomicrostroma glucosiphilum TaxID=1684307 RepID=A0A316U5N3_9BASI|nr:hypothetical protein BCV69DRAFT_191477 [Pseudomicrostroma glucosiphilum]PWN20522.1 hypothetical protein BCV69DRAFT_191477 [Pseudomicrostroma glucosiphilum]
MRMTLLLTLTRLCVRHQSERMMAVHEGVTVLSHAVQVQYFQLLAQLQRLGILDSSKQYSSQDVAVWRRRCSLLALIYKSRRCDVRFRPSLCFFGCKVLEGKEAVGSSELCLSRLSCEGRCAIGRGLPIVLLDHALKPLSYGSLRLKIYATLAIF